MSNVTSGLNNLLSRKIDLLCRAVGWPSLTLLVRWLRPARLRHSACRTSTSSQTTRDNANSATLARGCSPLGLGCGDVANVKGRKIAMLTEKS